MRNNKLRGFKFAILFLSSLVIIETIALLYLLKVPSKEAAKIPEAIVPKEIKGRIAIVLDDWGYNLNNLELLRQIQYPLTASILPGLSYSRSIAEELHGIDVQIILHLPMEPIEKFRLEKNTIMTSMDEKSVKDILEQDLLNVPYAVGVSNHMGSKATQDVKTMELIFEGLKKRGLYFLDSIVSADSICEDTARKIGLPFLKRDVFLDNETEPEYIKKQLHKLMNLAGRHGQAVGIGHDRKNTLAVLKDLMPAIEKQGFKFVYLSELVR